MSRYHGRVGTGGQTSPPPLSKLSQGFFGRMFRQLEPHSPPGAGSESIAEYFRELAAEMVEPERAGADWDNRAIPAGYTYLGQFITHDITFDPVSSLVRQNDPDRLVNFRTPRFDLDSVYGPGPEDAPYLYERKRYGRLLTGEDDDLLRNPEGTAIIGDPRNDENPLVAQLHLAFVRFHNAMMEAVAEETGVEGKPLFAAVQREVRWTYQQVVVYDYLERICGRGLVEAVLAPWRERRELALRFYVWDNAPFMPVEFSAAAFRFGHSMIRDSYRISEDGPTQILLIARSGERAAGWSVQWDLFFEIDGSFPQWSRLLDTRLARSLTRLPTFPEGENVLAQRDLLRGHAMQLPSGQAVARAMGEVPLEPARLEAEDPLWFYVLREAEVEGGRHLGPVGGRIVAEVLLGLLEGDPHSWIQLDPLWKPPIPLAGDNVRMGDILRFARQMEGLQMTSAKLLRSL